MGKIQIDLDGNILEQLEKVSQLINQIGWDLNTLKSRSKEALNFNPEALKVYENDIKRGLKGTKPAFASSSDMEKLKGFDFGDIDKLKDKLLKLNEVIGKGVSSGKAPSGAGKNLNVYREVLSGAYSKLGEANQAAHENKYGDSLEKFREITKTIDILLSKAKHENRTGGPSEKKPRREDSSESSRKAEPKGGNKSEPSVVADKTGTQAVGGISMKDVFDDADEALAKKVEEVNIGGILREELSDAAKSAVKGSSGKTEPPADADFSGKKPASEISAPESGRSSNREGSSSGGELQGMEAPNMLSDSDMNQLMDIEEQLKNYSEGMRSFGTVLDDVYDKIPKTREEFGNLMNSIGESFSDFFGNIRDKLEEKKDSLFGRSSSDDDDYLEPIEIKPLESSPSQPHSQAPAVPYQQLEEEYNKLDALAGGIQHPVDEAINGVLGGINSLWGNIQGPMNAAIGEITGKLEALPDGVREPAEEAVNGIQDRLSYLSGDIQQPLSNAFEEIQNSLDNYIDNDKIPLDKVVNNVLGSFNNLSNEIKKPLDEIANESRNILSSLPNEVQQPMKGVVDGIVNRLSALSNEIQKPLDDFVNNSLNSLSLLPGQTGNAVSDGNAAENQDETPSVGNPKEEPEDKPNEKPEDIANAVAKGVEEALKGNDEEKDAPRDNSQETPPGDAMDDVARSEAESAAAMQNLNSGVEAIRDAIQNNSDDDGSRPGTDRRGTVRINGQQIPLTAYDNNPELRESFMRGVRGNTDYGRISRSAARNTRMRQEEQDLRMANMAARVGGNNPSMQFMNQNGDPGFFRNLLAASARNFSAGHFNFNLGQMMSQSFSSSLSAKNFNHALNRHGLDIADTWKTDAVWEGDEFKDAMKQTQAFADLLEKVNSELQENEDKLSDEDLYEKLKNKEIGRSELTSRFTQEDIRGFQGSLSREKRKNLLERIRGNDNDRAIVTGGLARENAGKGIFGGLSGLAKVAGPIGLAVTGITKLGKAAADLGQKSIEAYGQVQSLQTQLGVVFGSQSASSSMFQEIEEYAKHSPFGVAEMTQGAIGLKQSGVYGADLMDVLKSIGDLSSGNKDKFKSITDVYSRVMASTTVTARDMRQLANAGVASYSALAKATGIERSEIRSQLQAGNIKSTDFQKMVEMLTTNGGMFEGATKKGAATIEARKQNLQDAKQMAMSEMGRWITNLGFDGESSVFSKLLGVAESINQNIEEHFKKVNDKKDSEAAEKAEKKYAELIKKANEAEARGNYSESDKLFEEANTILNGDAWSKTAQANIARYERAKTRLAKGGLSIYEEQDLDKGELGSWWADFKETRDAILNEFSNDWDLQNGALQFMANNKGISYGEAMENRQSLLQEFAESDARKQLEHKFDFAGQDFDFEKMWAAFHDAAGNEITGRETYYAEKAGTTIDGENAVSIAQDASVQIAGYMHDANEVFSKGFAWIDAQTQAVDKWVNITTKGVGDLEAAQNRMNSAQTDWVQNSPLAQMMSRDEKARRDEVLKGRITEMADKTYNKDTGNYEFGGLDITEFVEAEKLLTATAEEMSFEFKTLTTQIDDGFGNTKTVISEQGAETLETFRANLNEYYESLLNSNPTEYLDNDTLDHFKSLWEGLAGDISQFDETKITEIGKLINVIGESLEKAAASGDERAQAALTGYKNTGTKMTRDASKAQYLNKRKQADLWAQILSQATGVDASRVQLSGQKAVMDAYTKNFARRDMFSTLGKSLMKNGASLKELSDILKKNSEGMSGGKGMFDWVSASREAEELAAKRNVETQDALIAAYQQQIDALSDLEMAGVATRDTWDNLTSLSAQLGTGFTLAAQEMADGTYRFTEETIRSAEKMKRELDMRKVIQQMDSIVNKRISELNRSTGETHVQTEVLGTGSLTVEQAGEYASMVNQELQVFTEANKETVAELIKNNDKAGNIFKILEKIVNSGDREKIDLDIDWEKLNQDTTKEVTETKSTGSARAHNYELEISKDALKKANFDVKQITDDWLKKNGYLDGKGVATEKLKKELEGLWKSVGQTSSYDTFFRNLINGDIKDSKNKSYVQKAVDDWLYGNTPHWKNVDKAFGETTYGSYNYEVASDGSLIPYKNVSSGTTTTTRTIEDPEKKLQKEQEENKLNQGLEALANIIKGGNIGDYIKDLTEILELLYPGISERMKESVKAFDRNTFAISQKNAKEETGKGVDQLTRYRQMLGWDTRTSKEAKDARAFYEMEEWAPTREHLNWSWEEAALEWMGLPTDIDFKSFMGRTTDYFAEGSVAKAGKDKEISELTDEIAELYKGGFEANRELIASKKGTVDSKIQENEKGGEDRKRYNQMVGSYVQRNMDSLLFGQDAKITSLLDSTEIPKDLSDDYKSFSEASKELEEATKAFNETLLAALKDGKIDEKEKRELDMLQETSDRRKNELASVNPDKADKFAVRYAAEGKQEALGNLKNIVANDLIDTEGIVDESALERVIELMIQLGLVTNETAEAFKELDEKAVRELLGTEQARQAMKNFGKEVRDALKSATIDSFLTTTKLLGENFYKMENSLMTQEECAESIKKSLAGQAAAMLENISRSAVDAGLKLIGAGALESNPGYIAAGLGLAAAGGFGGIAAGLLSGYANDSTKDKTEEKLKRLEALKENLADLLKQARDDAEYYEVNLRNKKAISTNEDISSLKVTKTNDMILSPNGVFSTAPDDYIFAMKDPASLARGNGGDVSVNFSIVNQSGTQLNVTQTRKSYNRDTGDLDLEVIVNGLVKKGMMDGEFDDAMASRNVMHSGTPSYA